MKEIHQLRKYSWACLLSTLLIAGLTACDSGDEKNQATSSDSSSASTTKRTTQTGPAVGILVDSPVSGISYAATSGKSGVTDE